MNRIAIIGCPGSGKSTLARTLQHILKLPLFHLDQYYWKPGWQRPERDAFKEIHDKLCDEDKWIIEGMHFRNLSYRLQRADTIIYLDAPRFIYLWRVIKRLILNYEKMTPSSPKGCPERFDWDFLKWVWNFNKRFRRSILLFMDEYRKDKPVYILRTDKDVKEFLNKWQKT